MLQNRGLDYAGADPTMLDLLRWHGAEEVERRSLVFDVYQNVCGSYWIRALSMVTTAPLFVGWWIAGARYLMAQDVTIDAKWRWRDWFRAAREYPPTGSLVHLRWLCPFATCDAITNPSSRSLHADGHRLSRVLPRRQRRAPAS